jgi:anti-sigma factor RsiW
MTIRLQTPGVRMKTVCTSPADAALLPAYIIDELDDAESETVQNHLNDCPHCKNYYLTMIEARSEAPEHALRGNNPNQMTCPPSTVGLGEIRTAGVRRKGKASGSLV